MARTPRSSRIPQWAIEDVVPIARALSNVAGPASNARIAQQLGVSPAGGKFRSRLGTARYYGFVRLEKGSYVLEPRGEAVLSDDADVALAARREAVMGTTFGDLIRRFSGREPNEAALAARLEDDFGSPAESARYQATTLIQAAREAGLISNGRFDAAAIESVPPSPPEQQAGATSDESNGRRSSGRVDPPRRTPPQVEKEQKQEKKQQREEHTPPPIDKVQVVQAPFAGVKVVVNVDASTWTPAQVAELLRELRGEPAPEQAPGQETEPGSSS
jgi:hypothetical protein